MSHERCGKELASSFVGDELPRQKKILMTWAREHADLIARGVIGPDENFPSAEAARKFLDSGKTELETLTALTPNSRLNDDYSHPNAIASKFEEIEERLDGIKQSHTSEGTGLWVFGSALAMILSWSRNASILYCIGHGIASWIYVIYFAITR